MIKKDQCNLFGIDDLLIGLAVGVIVGGAIETDDNNSSDDDSYSSYDEDRTDTSGNCHGPY